MALITSGLCARQSQLRKNVVNTMYVNQAVAEGEDICAFRTEPPAPIDAAAAEQVGRCCLSLALSTVESTRPFQIFHGGKHKRGKHAHFF